MQRPYEQGASSLLLHNLKNDREAVRNLIRIRVFRSVVHNNSLDACRAEFEQIHMAIHRKLAEPTWVERRLTRINSISAR